jgi:ligand-binding sensor domain-containing protein
MKNKFLFILTCILFLCQHLMSQTGNLYSTDNLLVSNFVTQVFQDHNGFIWITTRNGLDIYDGYQFRTISKEAPENFGLGNNYTRWRN